MDDEWILAADGGGSTCRMALARGALRHEVTLGAANVTTDFDGAVAVLRDGLGLLAEKAGLPVAALRPVPAYLGLAGVLDDADGARVADSLGLARALVEDDRPAAVRGALGGADGSVAGLGTGSFFARVAGGRTRIVGGWGSRLGDEASGFWLGREALRATLAAQDGLAATSPMTGALLGRFGSAGGIAAFAAHARPADIAALARDVVAAGETGDPVARDILCRGAVHVGDTLGALGHVPGQPVCLIGGVGAAYASVLPESLKADLRAPRASALDGALALAGVVAVSPRRAPG